MNNFGKIIVVFILILFGGPKGIAQSSIPQSDSLHVRQKKVQNTGNANGQNAKETKERGNSQAAGNNKMTGQVKQIKSGRPDMSKARGARPPSVVRPSGSGIPRGVGKPGGVGRKGGR